MAYQWSAGEVHTTQHRAATTPAPSKPPFSTIPPSLRPGHRHHTFSATGTNTLTSGSLCFGPSSGTNPRVNAPATAHTPGGDAQDYFSMNPLPYRDFKPPPLPLPMPQSILPQSVVPPLPPKAPIKISPTTTTPTLPPKPPPFTPPPNFLPPALSSRSQSQPPPLMPRGASAPSLPPPPPLPTLPPKPLGARSPSLAVKPSSPSLAVKPSSPSLAVKPSSPSLAVKPSSGPHHLSQPNVSLIAKPSSTMQEPNALPTFPSEKSPTGGSSGMDEEEEFKLALELSKQTERERANALLLAQDEDLARALEQSLIDSASRPERPEPSGSRPGPSTLDNENVASSSSTIPQDTHPRSEKPVSRNVTLLSVDGLLKSQLKEDEDLARRLETEYDSELPTPTSETNQGVDHKPSEGPTLPRYADIVGKETVPANRLESNTAASPQVQLNSARSFSNPDQVNTPSRTPSRNTPSPTRRTSPRRKPQTTRASQEEAAAPKHSPASPQPPRPVVTPHQFVEPELLYGASFGSHPPPVENVRFRGGLPNALTLCYGKGQPMHIRASSWRQLLKLLAKLSATQIEPTVEARAETKGELRLRTVVQFFRVHPSSTDWRTVIYLTIDYPPPPDHRYTTGVVNSLPYSYSLSTLPALLRDGPDSSLSKFYTIPETSRTPLPKLPVSMPDMAMYLAEALEDSRRARGDSSNSHRRLAKMINQFYPNKQGQAAAEEEPRGRGRAFIGRLMGRPSKPPGGGGHNADMYDVVTPFVSEWG